MGAAASVPASDDEAASLMREHVVVWECQSDEGYRAYEDSVALVMERALPTRAPCSWHTHGFAYELDWATFSQVNCQTKKSRPVRRTVHGHPTRCTHSQHPSCPPSPLIRSW